MAVRAKLSPAAVRLISKALDGLFDRIRSHVIGDKPPGKQLYIAYRPELTLKGIFDASAEEEGTKPADDTFKVLKQISESYLDATREKMKSKTIKAIQDFLFDASRNKVKTNLATVLGGKLEEVGGEIQRDVRRILETESTVHRNTSIMDAITKTNALAGVEDPVVFFVVVRDQALCEECRKLHMRPDGVTPRVWRMSELGSGYHKRGDPTPKVGGLHPHCRCVLTTLLPGYGFNAAGRVTYIEPGHDEYKRQNE